MEPPVADGGNGYHPREKQAGSQVAQVERHRRQVPQGRAHGEGRYDGRPVERLAPGGVDGVDRHGLLGPLPTDEHGQQHDPVEGARHRVRDTESDMKDIGGHRAEHAHHDNSKPVRPCDVAPHRELQRQGGDETDEPQADGQFGVHPVDEVVGRRFAHRRREGLYRPEIDRDLGHPERAANLQPCEEGALGHGYILPRGEACPDALVRPVGSRHRCRRQVQRPRNRSICRRSLFVGRPAEGSRTSTRGVISRGGGGGLWSTMHPAAMGAPTRLSIARTTSSTRSRSPIRAVTVSPGCTVVEGFAPAPFTLTCPARHSAVDAARVGAARTAHSHRSTRATSTGKASHERAGSAAQ